MTRRRVLAGVAGIAMVLTGCTTGAPQKPAPPARDPLADLLDEHLALAAAYGRAISAQPDDARIPGLAQNVTEHISALAGALAIPPPISAPEPGEGSAASAAEDPPTLLGQLQERETALAAGCSQLAITQPARRAPLLASIATAHRCAAAVLE